MTLRDNDLQNRRREGEARSGAGVLPGVMKTAPARRGSAEDKVVGSKPKAEGEKAVRDEERRGSEERDVERESERRRMERRRKRREERDRERERGRRQSLSAPSPSHDAPPVERVNDTPLRP